MTVTWNPSDIGANLTLSGGNLICTASSGWNAVRATLSHNSGKQYVEFIFNHINNAVRGGLATSDGTLSGNALGILGATASLGIDNRLNVYSNEGITDHTAGNNPGFINTDVLGVAIDITNGNIFLAKNNNYTLFGQASSNPATGANPPFTCTTGLTFFPAGSDNTNTDAVTIHADSSNQTYAAPTGFTAWGGAAATTNFRRSLSALGTRTGTRQGIIF